MTTSGAPFPIQSIVVYHTSYGCETGCCGHMVEINDVEINNSFDFDHPYGDTKEEYAIAFAQHYVTRHYSAEHIADLDWEKIIINWERVSDD